MANVVREDQENLTALVTVNLAIDDYHPKVDSELKKLRKKLRIKGFREGKTPMAYIKKLYGNQVLVDEINNVLNEQLNSYLRENKVDILGQPLPVIDQLPTIDINKISDIAFQYELGLVPEFEVKGLGENEQIDGYEIAVDDQLIEREINRIRKQAGTKTEPEEVDETAVLSLNIVELDGDEPKKDGLEKEISASVDLITDKKLKGEVLKLKKGDSFKLNINHLEDRKPEDIRKYIIGSEHEDQEFGDLFTATITNIQGHEPAELNQDLFDRLFGPGAVDSEEGMRSKLEEDLKRYYESQADGKLFVAIRENLMEQTQFDLPDEFLKRWLKVSNEELSDDQIVDEYESFAKSLKWSLIQGKLSQEFDIAVSQEELVASFEDNVRGYFQGAVDDEMLKRFTDQMMSDENSVNKRREEMVAEKLFNNLKDKVKVKKEPINWKAFDELSNE